jgi:EAL domain-containing protein (putative c-di-GMP-specific phosphodiesterase class I)
MRETLTALIDCAFLELDLRRLEATVEAPNSASTGLLQRLDEWVAEAFTAQRRAWHTQGLDPHVGLNLSPSALSASRIERILELLLAADLEPERVAIEISESEMLHDNLGARAALRRIDAAGLTLALDDFGVAYSSLARLRDVPTQWIKIDKTFLRGVPERHSSTRVLDAMLQLLEALEVRVIVEGVESAAQVGHLHTCGCEAAQGYFLCPPLPAGDLEELLRASPDSRHHLTAPRQSAELRG